MLYYQKSTLVLQLVVAFAIAVSGAPSNNVKARATRGHPFVDCSVVLCIQPPCPKPLPPPPGQCCPVCPASPPSEGSCPKIPPGTIGICILGCISDEDCSNGQKCCFNGCGQVCTDPVLSNPPTDKPGKCPIVPPGTIGICVERCSADEDCEGSKKCCSNGCGHVCVEPDLSG